MKTDSISPTFLVSKTRMEFPITRERLQTYRANDAAANHNKQRVLKELNLICKFVEQKVLDNERKYIYEIRHEIKHGHINPCNGSFPPVGPILKELLEAIKNSFLGCTILIDPLETYIIIDWS